MLAEQQMPTKATLSLPFSLGQGRENATKGLWIKTRASRDHSVVTIKQNRLGKISLIYY